MKKFIILSALLVIVTTCCASSKRSINVREIYYAVNNDSIDRNSIIENRFLTYDKEWQFLSGYILVKKQKESLSTDASEYYRLPLISSDSYTVERDSNNRITLYETDSETGRIVHSCKYDQWGNLTEDKSVYAEDPSQIVEVLTYEYFYLTNFDYKKKKDGKLEIKSVNTSPWVLRTIRMNGRIVEFTERKIENK